jgi:hypothetical protein
MIQELADLDHTTNARYTVKRISECFSGEAVILNKAIENLYVVADAPINFWDVIFEKCELEACFSDTDVPIIKEPPF